MKRLVVVLVCLGLSIPLFAAPVQNPTPVDDPFGSGGSGSCTYCSSDRCGCASAPLGFRLDFDCACSGTTCSHNCIYTPI